MTDNLDGSQGLVHPRSSEPTVRYVFGLIWPQGCIDCIRIDDSWWVSVDGGSARHVVRVPCALVDFDQGMTLVRAVYKSGLPDVLCCAKTPLCLSL